MSPNPLSRIRFFGGGGSSVKQVDPLAGTGVRELYPDFTKWLQPQIGAVTAYPGQVTPGPSNLQQQGFDLANSLTPVASGGQEYAQGVMSGADSGAAWRNLNMAESGLNQMSQPFDPQNMMNSFRPSMDLATDYFKNDLIPAMQNNYVSRTGTPDSGALNRSIAREGGRLAMGLGADANSYMFQGEQNQLNRNAAVPGQAMNLANSSNQIMSGAQGMGIDVLSRLLDIGNLQRGITGEQNQESAGRYAFEQPYNSPWINALSSLSGGAPKMDTINQQSGPGAAGMLGPMLGSFLGSEAGAGMLAGGLSGGAAALGPLLAML